MNGFKEKIVREIIRLGKKKHSLRMPALALAALFLVAYHSVRNFFLQFRYHPVRQRILVGILVLSLLAGQIGIINVFAGSEDGTAETVEAAGDGEAGNAESRTISAFSELPDDVREQTVPVGTALEELTLPDVLEAAIVRIDHDEDTQGGSTEEVTPEEETDTETGETPGGEENGQEETGTDTEKPSDGEETDRPGEDDDTEETPGGEESGQKETGTDTEEPFDGEEADRSDKDGDTEETPGGEESGQEEAETDTEEPSDREETDRSGENGDTEEIPGGEESGQNSTGQEAAEEDTATEETVMIENAGDAGVNGDSAPSSEEGNAEITQETYNVTMPEFQAENIIEVKTLEKKPGSEDVTITGITWQSEPEYDGDTEGVYIFTAVLPKSYMLAKGISLPQITVTVQEAADGGEIELLSISENDHTHKVCGNTSHANCTHDENIEFEPFPENESILRGKSYYLTKDIELVGNERLFVEAGVTNICLNGFSIKKEGGEIIDINEIDGQFAELNICDCKRGGKIENTSAVNSYACISVIDDSALNIYGGTVDGGVRGDGIWAENTSEGEGKGGAVNIYGGVIETKGGSAIWLSGSDTSLSVYGGEISSSGYYAISVNGDRSKVSICGGKVTGSAENYYSTLLIRGEGADVTISGGSITATNFTAVSCLNGSLKIAGGEVKSEGAKSTCISNADVLVISGGTVFCNGFYGIRNCIDYRYGITTNGITTIRGGEINSAGSAIYNAEDSKVIIEGGNISSGNYSGIYNYGTLIMTDGKITGKGTYTIQNYENADLKISGGTIEAGDYLLWNLLGGSASISGGKLTAGNTFAWNNGTLDISDGEITSENHTPIVNYGTLSISGGRFGAKDSGTMKYIQNNKVLNLSGSPEFNNTSLWLRTNDNIGITGELAYSDPCTVYIEGTPPRILTSGWSAHMREKDPSDYFTAPAAYSLCTVGESDGEALLRLFMITFNANGGTCETPNTSVNDDAKATLLPEAKRKNYTFDGWFTAVENGEKVTADTVFTADTTVYAHWTSCSHIWSDTYEKDNDQHWKVCTKCNEADVKADHIWDGGTVTIPPTEEVDGVRTYTCTVCSATRTETIPPLEEEHIHNFSPDWIHDSTNHWHECDCGEKSELANHISSDWKVQTPATTNLEGVQIKNCTICGIELDRSSIDKLPNSGDSGNSGDAGNSGSGGDSGNSGGNGSDDTDNNGGSTPGDNSDPGTPAVTQPPATSSADTRQPASETEGSPDKDTETKPTQQPEESSERQPEGLPEQDAGQENTATAEQGVADSAETETGQQPESEAAQTDDKPQPESGVVQTVQASIADGRIVIDDRTSSGDGSSAGSGDPGDGGKIATGNVPGMADAGTTPETSTLLALGDGAVIVTVVCEEQKCTAGVADTVAVANAVLTPEQIQLVNGGETIEVRIDVKDISETVTGQDKEVIESGLTEYQKEIPELALGMYVDISMFIRIGEGGWDAVTSTKEPIEVVIGIPEDLQKDGREFYIIRSHEGEYTLLNDMDNDPDTITISTDMFSAYAIAYRQPDTDNAQGGNAKCGLCHICPTFLGICYFIWLAVIIAAILMIVLIVLRKKGEKEQQG